MTPPDGRVIVRGVRPPPAPSDALLTLVTRGEAVAVRRPSRDVAIFVVGLAVWSLLLIGVIGLRGDRSALPALRYFAGGLAWCAIVLIGTFVALRPGRGQVLPSSGVARIVACVLPPIAAVLAIALLPDAPGVTRHPEGADSLRMIAHCLSIGIGVAAVPLVLGLLHARTRLLSGRAWIGATVGIATGSLGALVLHAVCPVGGVLHVLAGHAGVLVAGAVLGAGVARLAAR